MRLVVTLCCDVGANSYPSAGTASLSSSRQSPDQRDAIDSFTAALVEHIHSAQHLDETMAEQVSGA